MKIYQVTSYYPPHVGGMEIYVQRLSEHLVARKNSVQVITSNIGSTKGKEKQGLLEVDRLQSIELFNTPFSTKFYSELMKASEQSIFHVHIAQAFLPEIAVLVAKRKKIPVVSHVHLDVGVTSFVGTCVLPLYKMIFLKWVLINSDQVIVQNEDYMNTVHNKYSIPLNKIVIIPNAIDLNKKQPYRENIKTPYHLLFVGRLVNQKRVDLLLQVIQKLKNKKIDMYLEIVGDGPDYSKLQEMTKKLGLSKVVTFCGSLNNSQALEKYRSADCLIQTSQRESFSTVLLESLNNGCPIVATDIEGTRNLLTHNENALLCQLDADELADAVANILHNQVLRRKFIHNGYKTVEKYSWQKTILNIEGIYKHIKKV